MPAGAGRSEAHAVAQTLEAGLWSVRLVGLDPDPSIEAVHRLRPIPDLSLSVRADHVLCVVRLPPEVLSDGLETVHLVDRRSGLPLATLHVSCGRALEGNLAAELKLLRDEIELLKRAFRRRMRD